MWDTDTLKEVKEKKSKEEGVAVNDVDLTHEGTRLDDDQQWWQTNALHSLHDIYMYKR